MGLKAPHQWRSQSSDEGGEINRGRAPWPSWPLPKIKLVVFRPLYFRGAPLGPMMGPLEPGIGPVKLKIDPYSADEGPPENVNCSFSLNLESERLRYIIVCIENGPLGSERG